VKNTEEIGNFNQVGQNIYCNPYILQIINSVSLQFLKFKRKVDFGSKLYFFYFFVIGLKDTKKKTTESGSKERIFVRSILTLKIIDICVKLF